MLKKIGDQQKEILSQAEDYENQATSINQTLDLIKTGSASCMSTSLNKCENVTDTK